MTTLPFDCMFGIHELRAFSFNKDCMLLYIFNNLVDSFLMKISKFNDAQCWTATFTIEFTVLI